VRPQAQGALVCSRLHPFDIALDPRVIDEHARGPKVSDFHGMSLRQRAHGVGGLAL
jgi:hypothetical protein